jgi:hypothetical protein
MRALEFTFGSTVGIIDYYFFFVAVGCLNEEY